MKQKDEKNNPTLHTEMLQNQEREHMCVSEKNSMSQEVIKTKNLRKFENNWILTYVPANPKLSELPHFILEKHIKSYLPKPRSVCFILYGK